MSEPGSDQPLAERGSNRSQRPRSEAFRRFIASGWAEPETTLPARLEVADLAAGRRARLSARFPSDRLVLPAGELRTRSNDTDYRFRAHSAFAHLTGLGVDAEPDSVLVLHPDGAGGHDAVLYFRPRAGHDSEEFYADARYGELWVGARPTLEQVEALTGLQCRHIDDLAEDLAKDAGPTGVLIRVVPGASSAVEVLVAEQSGLGQQSGVDETSSEASSEEIESEEIEQTPGEELAEFCSELRLVKDEWEVAQLREAIAASVAGFEDIVRALPQAREHRRGERVVETVFERTARREGNGTGYDTIAAAGAHACTLHWIDNDGPVRDGDLILVDAGVEVDSLYTADITRTLPVSGRFTDPQRQVYEAVLAAADAAFAVAKPGATFHDVHDAAMVVIAQTLHDWGLLPDGISVDDALDAETGGQHRRWMVHGTSHHLGLDVHDCAQARREMYLDAILEPGMVFTIEPGLYFKPDDLLAPPQLRGIGVRIEDDVLVTADGCENLTAALPRGSAEVEAWMAALQAETDEKGTR